MPSKKICKCGKPSVPGLISKVALCQYHFDERMYGKEWADRCKENEPHQSESKMKFKTGTVKAHNIDLDEIDFAVDTALSWEGNFPEAGKGDYLVTIGYVDGEPANILVSRRYTSAVDADDAAKIALDAFAERHDYDRDDEGHILEVALEGLGTGVPCWVERVDRVTK